MFDEDTIKETEKLPGKVKKSLEKGGIIKEKWNKENEISSAINDCLEFEENLKKINDVTQKIKKYNSKKISIVFTSNTKKLGKEIKNFGLITEDGEIKSDDSSEFSKESKNSRKFSISSENSEKCKSSKRSKSSKKSKSSSSSNSNKKKY